MKKQRTHIRISKLLCIASLASLCLGGAVACTKRITENCVLTSEDYAVYSSVFLDIDKRGNSTDKTELIISEATVSGEGYDLASQDVQRLVKEASDDTVASFNARRKSTCHLKPHLSGAISYRVVSSEDLTKAFTKDRGGWESFYKEYPRTAGIVHLWRSGTIRERLKLWCTWATIAGVFAAGGILSSWQSKMTIGRLNMKPKYGFRDRRAEKRTSRVAAGCAPIEKTSNLGERT
jgi:hypothetical protein